MIQDNVIKHTVRININNPQHRKVNAVLMNLDQDICKSRSQFLIDAAEYYIEHFGKEAFVEQDTEADEFLTRGEFDEVRKDLIVEAVSAAKDEMIRILSGRSVYAEAVQSLPQERTEADSMNELLEDGVVGDLASSWVEG